MLAQISRDPQQRQRHHGPGQRVQQAVLCACRTKTLHHRGQPVDHAIERKRNHRIYQRERPDPPVEQHPKRIGMQHLGDFAARQFVGEPGLLAIADETGIVWSVGQIFHDQYEQQHRGHAGRDGHPLPASETECAVEIEQQPSEQRAEHVAKWAADRHQRDGLHTIALRKPQRQIEDDAGIGAGFRGPDQKAGGGENRAAEGEAEQDGEQSPRQQDAREP